MDHSVTTRKSAKGRGGSSKTGTLESKKREYLKEKLKEKLEHERRALQVVERLSDSVVPEDILIQSARLITVDNYKDVVEERSIAKLCGYPISVTPGQKYKISTRTNKVYDITERKCFCCNFCYKASKWFEVQISKTPLWLREHENLPDVKLMAKEDGGSSGLEVKLLDRPVKEADIENPGPPEPLEPSDELCTNSDEGPQSEFISSAMSKCNLRVHWGETTQILYEKEAQVGKQRQLEHYPNKPETAAPQECSIQTSSSANAELVISDKSIHAELVISDKSIHADDCETEAAFLNQPLVTPSPQATSGLIHTLDETGVNVAQVGMTNTHVGELQGQVQHPRMNRPEAKTTKLSLMECLKLTLLDWKTEETMEFLYSSDCDTGDFSTCLQETKESSDGSLHSTLGTGKPAATALDTRHTTCGETPAVAVNTKTCSTVHTESQDLPSKVKDSSNPVLPLVDCHSQHAIQKGIVVEKLSRSLKNILGPLSLTMKEVSTNINSLVRTFKLTSTNIIHKGPVWTLIAVIVLHVLTEVCPPLRESLARPSSKEFIASLIKELELTDQDLQSLVQLFCQDASFHQ
ncbi:hypothetical protein ACEWY4_019617 [Coilia grayii]|uniref:RNA polymerase II subunit B1 CTD phosphatase RPAP2 homolog n=1 Tax=Coilia grayii TaxID=363190 RepID=A0ABD1JBF4_9TELE